MAQSNNYLITISGPDHPGITSHIMDIISKYEEINLRDIGQSVALNYLSLNFVMELPKKFENEDELFKELLFAAKKQEINLDYVPVKEGQILKVPSIENLYHLRAISPGKITPRFIGTLARCFSENKMNILRIYKSSFYNLSAVELIVQPLKKLTFSPSKFRQILMKETHDFNIDLSFIHSGIFRTSKRLVIFDMDSTLIKNEVIVELGRLMGKEKEIDQITQAAMNGELSFISSFKERVSLLKGLKEIDLKKIYGRLVVNDGVQEFIKTIKKHGYKTAVVSGGFQIFADYLKKELKLDYAFANNLEFVDGECTGKHLGKIIDGPEKAKILKNLAQKESVLLDQVVAIGDGANDIPMLSTAGMGIAFHAKKVVKESAGTGLDYGPMTGILHFLGIVKT